MRTDRTRPASPQGFGTGERGHAVRFTEKDYRNFHLRAVVWTAVGGHGESTVELARVDIRELKLFGRARPAAWRTEGTLRGAAARLRSVVTVPGADGVPAAVVEVSVSGFLDLARPPAPDKQVVAVTDGVAASLRGRS